MAKAPKVDKFHTKAPEDVIQNLDDIIDKHHEDLGDSHIQVWFKHGGWKSKSKTVFGKIQVMSDVFRRGMNCDAILYLNADMWKLFKQPQKNYLIDHFMYQLQTVTDRHGDSKIAMDGRPLLTTVPHDFEGYVDIVKRHGVIMEDVKRLASAMKETNQITIEEVGNEVKEEPREGIEYKLDGSGEVIVDKDQAELIVEEGEIKPLDPMAEFNEETKELQDDPDSLPM